MASRFSEETHAHLLTRTDIQMCRDCHKFFIITYEKNERGEAVETGYELDIKLAFSGVVRPEIGASRSRELPSDNKHNKELQEQSCF